MHELKTAYPLLRKAFKEAGGKALRLRPPGVKGIPDFVLLHRTFGAVFCEVKAVEDHDDALCLSRAQVEMLRDIAGNGGNVVVASYCCCNRVWALFSGKLHHGLRHRDGSEFVSTKELVEAISDMMVCCNASRLADVIAKGEECV